MDFKLWHSSTTPSGVATTKTDMLLLPFSSYTNGSTTFLFNLAPF